ncbi:MAG: hypothetical protein KDC87_21080 [Planctomycetes bacterium]|nr:hypothetical protein [Planctomycetota bacterium]MCB9869832.1 hypothetical protein [Planctomycetota bacterium]
MPQLQERAHHRDASRRIAYVDYTTPDGKRRQRFFGDAEAPKAGRGESVSVGDGRPAQLVGEGAADRRKVAAGRHAFMQTE